MEIIPSSIYQQAIDKQRIVIIGAAQMETINMLTHVLKYYKRNIDYVIDSQGNGSINIANAPVIIIASDRTTLADYQHHILVLTSGVQLSTAQLEALCNFSPKSGIIIYPEEDAHLKAIASKEIIDVTSIPYKIYKHEKDGSGIKLISVKNEKVPVNFSGKIQLEAAAAAKEVLKKIGISSSQFYEAIQSFAS